MPIIWAMFGPVIYLRGSHDNTRTEPHLHGTMDLARRQLPLSERPRTPWTIPYLELENAFCEEALKDTADLRQTLYKEMLGRIHEDDQSAPVKIGQYWHYSRTEPEKAYRIVARRLETMDAPEEVVLDENLEAEGLEYYSAQFLCFNPSQTHIAWLEDRDGGERFVLRVRELATGKEDSHSVTDLKWSLAWGDDETLFYLRSDHAQRPCAIWKRTIFASPETDTLMWSDPESAFYGCELKPKWTICASQQFSDL